MAAECCTILHGNDTLITEPQFRAGLRSRLDITLYFTAQSLYFHFASKYCRRKRNPHRRINVHALPLESRSCCHMDFQQQVSGFSTVCARHTFATTVTLANGASLENVSKMLGHSSIRMTQHYAKILNSSIERDMDKIESELIGEDE